MKNVDYCFDANTRKIQAKKVRVLTPQQLSPKPDYCKMSVKEYNEGHNTAMIPGLASMLGGVRRPVQGLGGLGSGLKSRLGSLAGRFTGGR